MDAECLIEGGMKLLFSFTMYSLCVVGEAEKEILKPPSRLNFSEPSFPAKLHYYTASDLYSNPHSQALFLRTLPNHSTPNQYLNKQRTGSGPILSHRSITSPPTVAAGNQCPSNGDVMEKQAGNEISLDSQTLRDRHSYADIKASRTDKPYFRMRIKC
ncbi:hypothetical protein MJO28_008810 [Puccinia striiformis f. sp. tritici]|uniref:Uncharacterized protein n=1 Tax=Puccinia striiformis f. sp. tritici TaxID=168172 RepID=A0ACC0EC04_9BASI|nr:hypothetical protein MJO28_008810 [Puccinia striiformis f. sp. tritici]